MNLKLIFLIAISIFFHTSALTQIHSSIQKKNQLELSTGYNFGFLQNLAFAPIARYSYNGLNHQLKYTHTSKRASLFEIQIDLLNSKLKSDLIPSLNADYSKRKLNFSYLRQIYNRNKFAIHLGLQAQINASFYLKEKRINDYQQKLGIASRFAFQIDEKQSLSSKLTIPFTIWRISTFEEDLYSFTDYQSVFFSAEYKYAISNHFDLKVNYNFNYDRLQVFNTYRELQHQFNLGINYKF